MAARAADTASDAGHTLHEVLRKSAHLQKQQRFLALCGSITFHHLDIGIFIRLFQAFQNSGRYASAVGKALSKYAGLLVFILLRLQNYAFGAEHGAYFTVGHCIVGISLDIQIQSLTLLGNTRADEYGDDLRILRFQHS